MTGTDEQPEIVNVDLEMGESDHHFTRAVEQAEAGEYEGAFRSLLWAYGSLNKTVHGLIAQLRPEDA